MEVNKVYLSDWTNNQLKDKSVQLIIADPPYFEVKGEFDFVWDSFDDYLKDVEKWAIECKRVLADNGTLFWYGDAKKIAYSQIIFDKYFNLLNSLVWRKKDSMQYQYYSPDLARSFNTHNERILMYSNKNVEKKFYYKNEDFIFIPLIDYISKGRKINIKELSKKTKIKETTLSHFFSKSPDGFCLANEDFFYKINPDLDYKYYVNLYNKLNNIYLSKRRFFYNPHKFEEVLEFSQESHITRKYNHDTKKPETLTRALIQTCSRKGDLVLVPFAGSGTECAMAAKEGRGFIGFDIEPKYVYMANERCRQHIKQLTMF